MDWIFGLSATVFMIIIALIAYAKGFDAGYKSGYRKGFDIGKREINKFALKTNHALGERIVQLNAMINKDKDEVVK